MPHLLIAYMVDCKDRYSLNYDYSDNAVEGPLPMTFCKDGGW